MSRTQKLFDKKLITPPKWLPENVHYETIMGSYAYGVEGNSSDVDLYGFCIPPLDYIFPHVVGYIPNFGSDAPQFKVYQEHHVQDEDKEYDLNIYNIVQYFQLCMDNNPNMIDSMFTPISCVQHSTVVAQMVREDRHMFLHKGCWHKFKGYSYSQLHKLRSKEPPSGKRKALVDQFGFDVKFAAHAVRLLGEVEQILMEGDLDIRRNREQIKSIRKGEWKLEDVFLWFEEKERSLEKIYNETTVIPQKPREDEIKQLLLNCLEHHFGSLEKMVTNPDKADTTLQKILHVLRDNGYVG